MTVGRPIWFVDLVKKYFPSRFSLDEDLFMRQSIERISPLVDVG